MTFAIRIVYEDSYYESLDKLVRRVRRDSTDAPDLLLECVSAQGAGGFLEEARKALRAPMQSTKQRPDAVVLIADGDQPKNLVPNAAKAPSNTSSEQLNSWATTLESQWKDSLVKNGLGGNLHTFVLCWSKESLLIAATNALLERAGTQANAVQEVFNACKPQSPLTVSDEMFTSTFTTPTDCLHSVFRALEQRNYKKGRDDEDLLRNHITPSAPHRSQVLQRCPDLLRLAELLNRLATSASA